MKFLCCLVLNGGCVLAQPVLYLVDHQTSMLHRVDATTMTQCPVGVIGEGDRSLVSMTMLDTWRGVTIDDDANEIITFDVRTAEILTAAPLDQDYMTHFRGVALSPDGQLYGLLPGNQLRIIDPETGITTFVAGLSGVTRMESLEFLADGTLIGAGRANGVQSRSFFEIDTTTGMTSEFISFNVNDIDAVARGIDDKLYFANAITNGVNEPIWRWDPKTGDFDEFPQDGADVINGLAASPRTCPADMNTDGVLNVLDFVTLQLAFEAGSCEADINGDAILDIVDFIAFQILFVEGCE